MINFRSWAGKKVWHFLGTIQEPWYTWITALANALILLRTPERVTHPGTLHPDKTFYVIRDFPPSVGVAGWYDSVLGYISRAVRKGWIPVVDAPPPALADGGGWNDFFSVSSGYSLAEVMQSRNVVLAVRQSMIHKRYNRRSIETRHKMCEMVHPSDRLQSYLYEQLPLLLGDHAERIVAVRYRGTDYRYAIGHAKVPDIDLFCDMVAQDMLRWNLPVSDGENILFVTEEQAAFESFRRRFPKCRFVEKERIKSFKKGLSICLQHLPTLSPLMNDFIYLLEIYAMSKCDYLIGGVNGGVLMALNLNGNRYKGVHVVNTGVN